MQYFFRVLSYALYFSELALCMKGRGRRRRRRRVREGGGGGGEGEEAIMKRRESRKKEESKALALLVRSGDIVSLLPLFFDRCFLIFRFRKKGHIENNTPCTVLILVRKIQCAGIASATAILAPSPPPSRSPRSLGSFPPASTFASACSLRTLAKISGYHLSPTSG